MTKFRFYAEDYYGSIFSFVCDSMTDIIHLHQKIKDNKEYRFVTAVIYYEETEL